MLHLGNNTKAELSLKGVSSGSSSNTYRVTSKIFIQNQRTQETLLNATPYF